MLDLYVPNFKLLKYSLRLASSFQVKDITVRGSSNLHIFKVKTTGFVNNPTQEPHKKCLLLFFKSA